MVSLHDLHVEAGGRGAVGVQPVLGEDVASVVPVGQPRPDEGVPPLMGAAEDVKLAGEETLGELGDVEPEGDTDEAVEDKNAGQEYFDLLTIEPMEEGPVKGRHEAINSERDEIDEPEDDVFVLVHLVKEHGSGHDECDHSCHVDGTGGGIAPEGIVNS